MFFVVFVVFVVCCCCCDANWECRRRRPPLCTLDFLSLFCRPLFEFVGGSCLTLFRSFFFLLPVPLLSALLHPVFKPLFF
ncbi:hypothetical protein DFJ73DRAFT_846325 [Zopfochytrium polystomum]|nr:hypothetical protein DFJ73DRAFT_846325 [Zopfochytrium polystomum]